MRRKRPVTSLEGFSALHNPFFQTNKGASKSNSKRGFSSDSNFKNMKEQATKLGPERSTGLVIKETGLVDQQDEDLPKAMQAALREDKDALELTQENKEIDLPMDVSIRLSEVHYPANYQVIESWAPGGFFINRRFLFGSIFLFPHFSLMWDAPKDVQDLSLDHFPLIPVMPKLDLLILGTGEYTERPNEEFLHELTRVIDVEYMGTRDACGVFNLLSQENRQVCAAIQCLEGDPFD